VTIYERIMSKANEIVAMTHQVEHGAHFTVWDGPTLKVFLDAGLSLRVFATAPTGRSSIQPWEVVAHHYLFVWGDTKPHFTKREYDRFVNQIKAALARIKK